MINQLILMNMVVNCIRPSNDQPVNSLFKLINQFIQGYFCVQSKFLLVAVVSGGWLNHQAFEQFFCKEKQAICTVVRGPGTKYIRGFI